MDIKQVEDMDRIESEKANKAAETFSTIYYDTLDKRRSTIHKFYMSNAKLIWNGRPISNVADINKFYEELPISSHEIYSLDAHPISKIVTEGQTTIAVMVSGEVRFNKEFRRFVQNFVLTTVGTTWKVVTDTFRFIDRDE